MLFDDPAKRYPHLVQVLNVFSRPKTAMNGVVANLSILSMPIVMALAMSGHPVLAVILTLVAAAGLIWTTLGLRKRAQSSRRELQARNVAERMRQMLAKHRLHRDLDHGSLTLLDECARQWLRVRGCLEDPIWSSVNGSQMAQLKAQAEAASHEAIVDILLHYDDILPAEVADRRVLDYVEEALDNIAKGGPGRAAIRDDRMPPAAFGTVRGIADRLRDLATETEGLAADANAGRILPAERPESALDETLRNLRAIREAEDELRQNLRG